MATELEFEKPITELKTKVEELRTFMRQSGIDLSHEVEKLENRLAGLQKSVYEDLTPWQRVQLARQPGRPTTLDYIKGICSEFVELHGDRGFRDDPSVVGGIGLIDGKPVTVIGTQKGHDTKENIYRNFGSAHPEGYRKALRLMKQAEKFGRPVVFFIDTQGAWSGMAAEERGISEAIAECLREMATLRVPTVSVVTGEGGSGGAIGLGLTDRILMMQYAWYCVITPEAAAAILEKDSTKAPLMAERMRMTAEDVYALGIIDGIVPEPKEGAHKDPQVAIEAAKSRIVGELQELSKVTIANLLHQRYHKFRVIGSFLEG